MAEDSRSTGNELYGHGPQPLEEYQDRDESQQPGLGSRIVAMSANSPGMIQMPAPVLEQLAEVAPPDLMRLVDVQRQQQVLGDLMRPMGRAPILQAQPPANRGAAGAPSAVKPAAGAAPDNGNGVNGAAPAAASRAGQPLAPAMAGRPVTPARRSSPAQAASSPAKVSAKPQAGNSATPSDGGKAQTEKPGFFDRASNYLHDVEKKVADTVSSEWHKLRGDQPQGAGANSSAQNAQGGQKPLTTEQFRKMEKDNQKAGKGTGGPQAKGGARPVSEGGNILMPAPGKSLVETYQNYSYPNEKNNTECVTFIQKAVGAPVTKSWKQGPAIRKGDNSIPPGTVIATFVDGHYSKLGRSNQHAAIYLGQNEQGIMVLNQHNKTGKVVVDIIPWKPHRSGLSNDGNAFSVVKW